MSRCILLPIFFLCNVSARADNIPLLYILIDGSVVDSANAALFAPCLGEKPPDTCPKIHGTFKSNQTKQSFYFGQAQLFYKIQDYGNALKFFNLSRKNGGVKDSCLFYMSESAFRLKKFKLGLNMHYAINDTTGLIKKEDLIFQRLRFFEYLGMDNEAEAAKLELITIDAKFKQDKKPKKMSFWAETEIGHENYFPEKNYDNINKYLKTTELAQISAYENPDMGEAPLWFSDDRIVTSGWNQESRLYFECKPFDSYKVSIQTEIGIYYDFASDLIGAPLDNIVWDAGGLATFPVLDSRNWTSDLDFGYQHENWFGIWEKRRTNIGLYIHYGAGPFNIYWYTNLEKLEGTLHSWQGRRYDSYIKSIYRFTPKLKTGGKVRFFYDNAPSLTIQEGFGAYIAYCEGIEDGQLISASSIKCYEDSSYENEYIKDPFKMGSDRQYPYKYDSNFSIETSDPYAYLEIGFQGMVNFIFLKNFEMELSSEITQVRFTHPHIWTLSSEGDHYDGTEPVKKYLKYNRSDKSYYFVKDGQFFSSGKNFELYKNRLLKGWILEPKIKLIWQIRPSTTIHLQYLFKQQWTNLRLHPMVSKKLKMHDWTLSVQQNIF